ncbi:hypothetical protein [Pseudomonas caspiana]|uniref:Secreted protein n=1 Tax=Pseudomonas caspiana TaxID=1451454 RepID=A0A1Y3P4M6_9PSED|nr:hypothetical protein [Pseudomonas caspiana]OUM74760.1 hypothetical protein AUC60_05035 [Pseudomonas caspiana]
MKLLRLLALLAPVALAVPLSAQAAMSAPTKAKFINDCVATAGKKLDEKSAKAHCECGAEQVSKNFSSAEIEKMSNDNLPPTPAQAAKMKDLVSKNCTK